MTFLTNGADIYSSWTPKRKKKKKDKLKCCFGYSHLQSDSEMAKLVLKIVWQSSGGHVQREKNEGIWDSISKGEMKFRVNG